MRTLFEKLEYRFLVENTKIESIIIPNKNAILEAKGK